MKDNGIKFYRCLLCHSVVSPWDIEREHCCPKCGQTKVSPSNLSFLEKIVQIIKHPRVWKWDTQAF